MKIAIIGTGYVGLPAGVCFADFGNEVVCVDKLEEKITALNAGEIPLYEPGLKEIFDRNKEKGRISFTTDLNSAIKPASVIILAVGTPTDEKTGHADLTYIKAAAKEISQNLTAEDGYKVIAIKSTVPVGTNDMVEELIKSENPNIDIDIASIPEFLREGKAVEDFMNPDRIVLGTETDKAKEILKDLYSPFRTNSIPIVYCNRKSAEMIKYASNAFLGVKISYINELSNLCEKNGADIRKVAKGMGLDSRIGKKFLNPGPGFGGSCFPKDMLEIITSGKEYNTNLSIVEQAIEFNNNRYKTMVEKIKETLGGSLKGKTIAILGLAFKAETDDIRMSPSIKVIQGLLETAATVKAYDPKAMENTQKILPNITYCNEMYETCENADTVVILTEWNEFKEFNYEKLSQNLNNKIIIDLRNILEPKEVTNQGFKYIPIGFNPNQGE
jgi:UDPglucose 6-dehydrogenase